MPHYGCRRGPNRTENFSGRRKTSLSDSAVPGTRSASMAQTHENDPVDLAALRSAAAPVVAWYEQLLAGRPMPIADLDKALVALRALPPVGGRLGRALALVATGGREATTDDTVAALELLRCSAGLRHAPAPAPAPPNEPAGPARRHQCDCTQLRLPGVADR